MLTQAIHGRTRRSAATRVPLVSSITGRPNPASCLASSTTALPCINGSPPVMLTEW